MNPDSSPPLVRLAVVIGQLGLGGEERQLYYFLDEIDRTRFDPLVITLRPGHGDHFEGPIQKLGVPLHGVKTSLNKLGRIRRVAAVLEDERCDVAHAWNVLMNPVVALGGRWAGVRGRIGSLRCNLHGDGLTRLRRWAGTRGLDHYVANSNVGREQLITAGISRERVHLIFNGIPDDAVPAAPREAVREAWKIPEKTFLVAMVGRLRAVKNQRLALRAAEQLKETCPRLWLAVIGDGPDRKDLESYAEALGISDRVRFLGEIADAYRYIHAADVLCQTSESEGMSNVLVEAGLAGIPSISADVGGASDVIVDGRTGVLIGCGDVDALAAALKGLYCDPARGIAMGHAAAARIREHFSTATMARALEQVYVQALSNISETRRKSRENQ